MKQISCRTEYDQLKEVLLCQPQFMKIKDVINDTQAHYRKENIKVEKALEEHHYFVKVLEKEGVNVQVLTPQPQFPEQVFTRDIGFVIEDTLYVANLKQSIRQGEEQVLKSYLEKESKPYHLLAGGSIEGGDVILAQQTVFIGGGDRTDSTMIPVLASKHPHLTFILIRFKQEYLHLDCVFNPISETIALVYKEAIHQEDFKKLKQHYQLIEVSEEEQFHLATNVLSLGNKKLIALPKNRETNAQLRQKGFTVLEVDFSEIIKSGGSFRCATMPITRTAT